MRESTESALDLAELQNFVEDTAPALTKLLAGASPEFAVRIKLKGEAATDLSSATEKLKKINSDWKFCDYDFQHINESYPAYKL